MADPTPAVDPGEQAILASIGAGSDQATPASAPQSDPNEAAILSSIQNHGTPSGQFRTPQDMALASMLGYQRMLAGIGKWFEDAMPATHPADGITDRDMETGELLPKGVPALTYKSVSSENPADVNASLESDPAGGFGHDIAAVIPSLGGGTAGAEAAGPLAARIGLKGFLGWLARASLRGASAGAGGGALSPADTPTQRLENTGAGAVGGAVAGPLVEGGINTAAAVPGIFSAALQKARSVFGTLNPGEIEQMVSQYLNDAATQTPDEAAAAIKAVPQVAGVTPTTAAATNDPGLYGTQALVRSKSAQAGSDTAGLFQQQVDSNDAALKARLGAFAPNASQTQVSTAAVDRIRALQAQAQAKVGEAYAPFDAVKDVVHVPSSDVLKPADAYFDSLSNAEKDALPSDIMTRIYNWDEYVPFKEVEGEMSALGGAANQASMSGDNNAARIIGGFRNKIDSGLSSVDNIYDSEGNELSGLSAGDSQFQAPLQALKAGRAANVDYRQQFPALGGNNTPDQNMVAKVISGDILPSKALDQAFASPENMAAFLKSAGDDPRVTQNVQNYAVNDLLDSSRGQGGQLDGTKLARNIDSQRAIYQQFFTPPQMAALDTISAAAKVNNAAMRRIMPGESGTAALQGSADNMADFVSQAAVAGVEHVVPGGGMAMKLLSQFKSGATQAQFDGLLTKALLDPATYIRLRNMPVNQQTVSAVKSWLLNRATPAVIAGTVNLSEQRAEKKSASTQPNQ